MAIALGALCPCSPLLALGTETEIKDHIQDTIAALRTVSRHIQVSQIQRLVLLTSHAPWHPSAFPIYDTENWNGDMSALRRPDIAISCRIDRDFVHLLVERAAQRDVRCFPLDEKNAHKYGFGLHMELNVLVPLSFLWSSGYTCSVVAIGPSGLPADAHRRWSEVLQEVLIADPVPTAVLAIGNLSQRLSEGSPGGFSESGMAFDKAILEALDTRNGAALAKIPADVAAQAGQRVLEPLTTLLEVLPENYTTATLSYNNYLGIGHCVACFVPAEVDKT